MPHYEYMEFTLEDGSQVRLELAPAGAAEAAAGPEGAAPDLPGGVGGVAPVGRGTGVGARIGTQATDALRTVLSPLGPVLQHVHDAISGIPDPPDEISVDFGIQIGQDLKLGIVGAGGQASLSLSATWQLPRRS
ncbi:CU044_2847 family protein [Streptomyces sp. NPDC058001]|uniref:CU044_2847 family protein n=1 Tax=Streptomyces sp. NPDC058001 TaxID=3346300 RepID=UPI0036F15844